MNQVEVFNGITDLDIERAADLDFIHPFKGFGVHKSTVQVQVWWVSQYAIVLLTDTGKGTSVTNAAEQIIEEIYAKYLAAFLVQNCFFMETYSKSEGIDLILPSWTSRKSVSYVQWKHIGKIVDPKIIKEHYL